MRALLSSVLMLIAAGLSAGAALPAGEPPAVPAQTAPVTGDKAEPRISPDGARISYLAPVNGVLNVWVSPVGQPESAKPVTDDKKRGIHTYSWAFTNHHIIYLQDKDADENWHVCSVNIDSGVVRDLTPLKGVQARVQTLSPVLPSEILVGLSKRDSKLYDIYRVNTETGQGRLVFPNDSYAKVMADDQYRFRVGFRPDPQGGLDVVELWPSPRPRPLFTLSPKDALKTHAVDFDKSGKRLYLLDSRGRSTAELTALDLDTRQSTVLALDAHVDVGGVLLHPTEKTPQAYWTRGKPVKWYPLDPAVAKDLHLLRGVAKGDLAVVSRTLDDSAWIVSYDMGNSRVRYYLYDRKVGKTRPLFESRHEPSAGGEQR